MLKAFSIGRSLRSRSCNAKELRAKPAEATLLLMTVASILPNSADTRAFRKYLSPEPSSDGRMPENRVVQCGVSWESYLALDQALGDDRPGPRFYYLDQELEVMTTSNEHERIKKWLSDFLSDYFLDLGVEIFPRGQATIRSALENAGAEPDESWCVGREKEFPDLILEIALTSGGVRKLELYRRFGAPEVWFWRRDKLTVFALREDRSAYEESSAGSRLLPGLDLRLLERCVAIPSWQEARRAFRAGLAQGAD